MVYVSPQRAYMPPSDIESEYGFGGEESDHETNTVKSLQKKSF
jgi:hypothetical protein